MIGTNWFLVALFTFLGILLVISAVLFVIEYMRYRAARANDAGGRVKPPVVIGVFVVATVAAIVILGSWAYIHSNTRELEYRLELEADGAGVLLVPVTANGRLQNRLEVNSGDGDISIVDTPYGRALRVEFSGPVTISGDFNTIREIEDRDLSMPQPDNRSHWASLEPGSPIPTNVTIHLKLTYTSRIGSQRILEIAETLDEGWSTYHVKEILICV